MKLPDRTNLQYTQQVYTTCSQRPMKSTHYHSACSWPYLEKSFQVIGKLWWKTNSLDRSHWEFCINKGNVGHSGTLGGNRKGARQYISFRLPAPYSNHSTSLGSRKRREAMATDADQILFPIYKLSRDPWHLSEKTDRIFLWKVIRVTGEHYWNSGRACTGSALPL